MPSAPLLCLLSAILLAGCGAATASSSDPRGPVAVAPAESNESAESAESTKSNESAAPTAAGAAQRKAAAGPSVKLVARGFGQEGRYVWATALVQNRSAGNVGKFATVRFTLLDAEGQTVAKTRQVEIFSRADQQLVLARGVEVPQRSEVKKVEAKVEVGPDSGDDAFPKIPTGPVKVTRGDYGDTVGRVTVTNPTKTALEFPRVGLLCFDEEGDVVGGGSGYPRSIPPAGETRLEVHLVTRREADRCEAHVAPGV